LTLECGSWENKVNFLEKLREGTRQSGKTTLLKTLQDYLIRERKVNPENIIFLTLKDREVLDKFLVGRMFSFYLYQLNFEEFISLKSKQLDNVYQKMAFI